MATADLAVTKKASASSVTVGQQFTYTITVLNNGPDPATDVVMTDTVPAGACLNAIALSPIVGSYTYTANTIEWNIGGLAVNASVTMTVTVTACTPGVLVNTAIVTGAEDDPNPSNNSDSTSVTVTGVSTPSADLGISKESCPSSVTAGTSFTYLISAINNGPSPATGVVVTDTLPPGLIPLSAVSSPIGACTISGNTVTCQIGTMPPDERVKIVITVQPFVTGVFENTASITSDGLVPDPNPGNNTDSAITEVVPAAALTISKTASEATVIIGDTVTYTITVTNPGPSDAGTVLVTDTLPPSFTVLSINASQGSGCTPIGINEYLCNLGTLASDATATITIVVRPTEPGNFCNTASVTSSTTEIGPGNNTASICTLVKRPEIDLAVTKTHTPEQDTVCAPLAYTITVTNNGPAPATGVVLVDQLPASFQVLSVCSSQGRCSSGCGDEPTDWHCCERCGHKQAVKQECCSNCGNEVICQLGALAVGASATVQICVKPCQTGTFTNTAIATANEDDLNPANNQATDTITVVTMSERIDYLLSLINQLIITGVISEEDAAGLLTDLNNAKHFIFCGSAGSAEGALEHFIQTVYSYISHSVLPSAAGCSLIQIAEGIKLGCPRPCTKQGDECCEPQ